MRTEADDADRRHGEQAERCGRRDPQARSPGPRGEHEERQHQPGGQLHADAARERDRRGARARPRGCGEQQRECQRHDQQGVVVGAADGEDEQHRVQSEEHGGERRRAAAALGRPRCQPHRKEAADGRQRFQRPQRAGQPERRRRVADEREQRAVRRMLERPADEAEDGVRGDLRRKVRVGVEPVQRSHPGERDVAEDVLGDQRRAEGQDHVCGDDRRGDPADRKRAGACQRQQVGAADDQHQRLETGAAELRAGPGQRAGQPTRPAAAVRRDIARRCLCGVEHEHEDRPHQREQRDRPRQPGEGGQPVRGGRAHRSRALRGCGRRWPGHLHVPILTAPGPAGVHRPR